MRRINALLGCPENGAHLRSSSADNDALQSSMEVANSSVRLPPLRDTRMSQQPFTSQQHHVETGAIEVVRSAGKGMGW